MIGGLHMYAYICNGSGLYVRFGGVLQLYSVIDAFQTPECCVTLRNFIITV